jgi:hypothetical protein
MFGIIAAGLPGPANLSVYAAFAPMPKTASPAGVRHDDKGV